MKALGIAVVILIGARAAADYEPTSVWWNDWNIATSENTFASRTHGSYPVTYMFDGDPKTAWVMTRDGRRLACDDTEDDVAAGFSPNGTYYAGIENSDDPVEGRLWVYNLRTGKRVVWRKAPPNVVDFHWSGNSRIVVKGDYRITERIPKGAMVR